MGDLILRVADVKDCDLKNGSGIRVSIWFQGCEHHCKGCQNAQTWDATGGIPLEEGVLNFIYQKLSLTEYSGVTLTGGDPFFSHKRREMLSFVKTLKTSFPDKNIWAYTGYTFEELVDEPISLEILQYIDVLVDGPYIESLRDVDLKWRGSSNQRVIDVSKSLSDEKISLFCE